MVLAWVLPSLDEAFYKCFNLPFSIEFVTKTKNPKRKRKIYIKEESFIKSRKQLTPQPPYESIEEENIVNVDIVLISTRFEG